MATLGLDFLSPRELQGILGDLHQGESFVEQFLPATPTPAGNGIIKKATATARFGLPQASAKIEPGESVERGPRAIFDDVPFRCQEYAWEQETPWTSAKRAEDYIPLFAYNAQIALDVIKIKRDLDVASTIATAAWGSLTTVQAADRWNVSTSYPNRQLLTMIRALRPARGIDLLMASDVWASYMTNANVLAGMNVSADHAFANEEFFKQAVAKQLGIRKVVVVDSVYNTSQVYESQVLADVFAGKVFLGQISDVPGVSSSTGAVAGRASALVRVQEAAPSLREYDDDKSRNRVAQAHMSEITVAADLRLGARLDAVLG